MLSIEFEGTDVMIQGLRDAPGRLQLQVATLMERTAHAIRSKAVALAPVVTGRLRQSIQVSVVSRDPLHIEVGPHTDYARFVEFGTRGGYFILPREKQALHWTTKVGGWSKKGTWRKYKLDSFAAWVYRAYGNKPKPYMRPAIKAGLGRMGLLLTEIMEKTFGK